MLVQFFVIFEKRTRAYLFQIAFEIIWLPLLIKHTIGTIAQLKP